MPSLSLSTIYRIMESLENKGLVRRVNATNGIVRYDGNLDPHQHLVCRLCGRITDFENESLLQLRLSDIRLAGFAAEELDIRIVGICARCHGPMPKLAGSSAKKTTKGCASTRKTIYRKKEKRKWPN